MKVLHLLCLFFLGIGGTVIFLLSHPYTESSSFPIHQISPSTTPTSQESTSGVYIPPKIINKPVYKIVMVGDSMTAALGIYGGKLSEYLNTQYKSTPGHQRIIIDNYAIGSTNILDLHKQMTTKLTSGDVTLDPLISVQPDLILIESFGYNPLSQLSLDEGKKTQIQTLDETMKFLATTLPQTAIVFVSTIAPDKQTYGLNGNPGMSVADRTIEVEERMAYIKNHMAYASSHHIPLIDIFDASLTADGNGNITYINPNDHIHPSFAGTDFIDRLIANYIFTSKILPH